MAMAVKCIFVLLSVGITSISGLTIQSLGCFNPGALTEWTADIIEDPAITRSITLEYCGAVCADYKYMSIQNNRKCNCGDSFNLVGSVASSLCNLLCIGNNAQKCGGTNHVSVYRISNGEGHAVADSTEEGCYNDQSGRDIHEIWVDDYDDMTNKFCQRLCCSLGYTVASTQYGHQCFCDDTFGKYGATTGCTTPCTGNPAETCGATWKNRVFTVLCTKLTIHNDPHFMMSSGDKNFCFNLHGKDEEIFNLISDSVKDITVRGETFETVVQGNLLSYFSKIGIYARHQKIVFGRNDLQVNSHRFEYNGNIESPIQVDDITITLIHEDPYKFIVKIGDDIKLMVSRSSNQHTEGFMGVYLLSSNGFTSNVNGIIGELIDTNFKIVEHQEGMKIEFDDHHESVPVSPMSMFSPDSKEPIDCYFYSGVLGNKTHYHEATLL